MTTIVQGAIDTWAKKAGMTKKAGSWYLSREETILVLDLQKSNYASRYFLNLAVWLRAIAPAGFPKEQSCHIRTRLSRLVSESERVDRLLDVEWVKAHPDALDELGSLLDTAVASFASATASLDSLRSARGRSLLQRCLVNRAAQELLGPSAS